jgi:hypothetical protein
MYRSVEVPQSVTIRDAGDFAARMRDASATGAEDIVLECAALDQVDLSFLQIVVAARAELGASGRTLSLVSADDGPVAALLARAGLAEPSDIPSWLKGTPQQ